MPFKRKKYSFYLQLLQPSVGNARRVPKLEADHEQWGAQSVCGGGGRVSLKRGVRSACSLSSASVKVGRPSTQPGRGGRGDMGTDTIAFQASSMFLWQERCSEAGLAHSSTYLLGFRG